VDELFKKRIYNDLLKCRCVWHCDFVIAISLLRRASPNGQAHRHDIVLILKENVLLVEATSGWRWHKLVPFLLEHFSLF
jgi:hypothetical protein